MLADNGPLALVTTFAASEAGLILVPWNTRLAPDELAAIAASAEPAALVHDEACAGLADEVRTRVPALRIHALDLDPSGPALEPVPGPASDVAQLYYTSGTSGRPKGVMLTHENVLVHALTACRELSLSERDRWGHIAPMFHLADAWATLAITAVGGTHLFVPRFDVEAVLRCIEVGRMTVTNLVPTMLNRLVRDERTQRADHRSLRLLLSGGAPISPTLVREILTTFGCEYVQTYGMTETSPYLTLGLLHEHLADLPADERLRIQARTGRAFTGVELEIVDERDRRVPADDATVGEIRVRGRTVTPGYWRAPEATAEAIRGGWLYTGDLAVIDAEGYVNIVDRKKDMIVTGGENVYSTEVEHVLDAHPDLQEAAVFGLPDDEWGEIVAAAVVRRPGAALAEEGLLAFCRARLAAFKLPRRIHWLEELPKTGSGKIAKRLLRERFAAR